MFYIFALKHDYYCGAKPQVNQEVEVIKYFSLKKSYHSSTKLFTHISMCNFNFIYSFRLYISGAAQLVLYCLLAFILLIFQQHQNKHLKLVSWQATFCSEFLRIVAESLVYCIAYHFPKKKRGLVKLVDQKLAKSYKNS